MKRQGTQSVAVRSRPLGLSQATKSKRLLKSSIILSVGANVWSTLWSMFYVDYSMRKNQKHHLIYALIITHLTYSIEMRSPHVVILPKTKHRFIQHAKSKFIESITNNNKPKQTVQELSKRQKNFCIRTLETLQPH